MADEANTTTDAAAETSGDSTTATATEATTEAQTTDNGEGALGDAGKKALDSMKAERKAAREEATAAKAERDALQAKLDGKEAEYQAQQAKRQAEQEALAKANDRIRKSEVKAAAKGVLADPADAYKFLDLDSFEVDDDGNVDEDAIASALADLVKSKPYLAAQGGQRFQGSADGGARNDASKPSQLTDADLARMSPEQIDQARKSGQLNDLLGIKT
jgi:hypothetical protein